MSALRLVAAAARPLPIEPKLSDTYVLPPPR